MKTYIVSIVPQKDELLSKENENLTTLALDEEHGDIIYRDKTTGEILVPARTGLSFQHIRVLAEKY